MNRKFLTLLAVAVVCVMSAASSQVSAPLPVDKNIRYGVLENGLTYYVRHNELPKDRAEFYIAQKVGSILEEDSQRGLAHFLEHMAFNGTKSYPGKSMLKYLESIGAKFGTDVNAYTSLDQTVYNLSNIPVIRESIVDSCLLVLYDWSCAISLEEKEIDSERGVIHEEWRTTSNPTLRMYEKVLPAMYPGNRYASRMPIGTMEVVDNFPYDTLRAYYHKWYRPDLQGIVVVGDINADSVEAKIKSLFGSIKLPEDRAERTVFPVADNKEPIIAIASDKEAQRTQVTVYYKHDDIPEQVKSSEPGLMLYYVDAMVSNMLNSRLSDITKKADAPFIAAQVYDGNFFVAKSKEAFTATAITKDDGVVSGLDGLLTEVEKVNRFGFTAAEYERAKANFMTSLESMYTERNKQKNSTYVNEYVDHFLDGGSISGIENEYEIFNRNIPSITIDMINQYTQALISEDNIVVSLMAAAKDSVKLPSESELLAVLKGVKAKEIEAYAETVSNEPLISVMPKAGKVKKVSQNTELDATVWTLSNGAKVVIKPTKFKEDQIIMNAMSKGGSSLFDKSDLINSKIINSVIPLGGIGNFSATDLPKVLAGKKLSVNSSIGSKNESVSASSSIKDLESMMQLVYLSFTAPRKDEEAYTAWRDRTKVALDNTELNPMAALSDSMTSTLYKNNPYAVRFKSADLDGIDYDRTIALYKERFADASDFVFTFVGNVDQQQLKPLVERYIASLPSKKGSENFRDQKIDITPGEIKNHFDKTIETPKSSVNVIYSGSAEYSIENDVKMTFLDEALSSVYIETLREGEGGTYGASVSGSIEPVKNKYALRVRFDTNEKQRDNLISIVHREIDKMTIDGPSDVDMQKTREYLIKQQRENLNENSYWMGVINSYYFYGINALKDYETIVNAQTKESIRDFAKSILKQGNVIEVVMNGKAKE